MISKIKKILEAPDLPGHDFIFGLAECASTLMETEITDYRQVSENGKPGSLLDFQKSPLPLIVVPDIHARPFFLENILDYILPEDFLGAQPRSVHEALRYGLVRLLCVGDALHTEVGTKERWIAAEIEFAQNLYTGPAISAEMKDGLAVICALMKMKEIYPHNFHFLKGNHENILNKTEDGDYGFRKFADEGRMVREFIAEYYGDDVLYILSCVEAAMPLIAVTNNCVISHAEPRYAFRKDQLINARMEPCVVEGLTWTDNDIAEQGSVSGIIEELCSPDQIPDKYVYLGGHRPVKGNYALRQGGRYIQIHNPRFQNIALVRPDKIFNPETDIVSVEKEI
ncbi:MAG: hypothetical protein IJR80_03435 [Treponema sp.]|nr:hypothetical protein [Treponema sp.]